MAEWDPTLRGVLEKDSLKWVFFGGKGGVGKTTNSCAFALELAERRALRGEKVLLLSTDPAHNVSDAFGQKFGSSPAAVSGCASGNLFAMEIDPDTKLAEQDEELRELLQQQQQAETGGSAPAAAAAGNPLESMLGMSMKDLTGAMPGIDEAMSFAEVLRMVRSLEFSVVVFDTAPTGHTLRLLAFPSVIQKTMGKILGMQDRMGGIFQTLMGMMGPAANGMSQSDIFGKLKEQMQVIEEVNEQFADPELTTFVCVCIPEFLSLYETERLIQALTKFDIDCQNIVVNQVLYPPVGSHCELCAARSRMQQKYLDQIDMLYDEFHVVKLPLCNAEVRGVNNLRRISGWQQRPYDALAEPSPTLETEDSL